MSKSPAPDTNDPALRTVAVLPFKNLSSNPGDAAIALGVPDIVLDRLTTVDGLTVVARDSAFRAGEESADPAEISQRLRAAFLVDGTVQRSGTIVACFGAARRCARNNDTLVDPVRPADRGPVRDAGRHRHAGRGRA